MKILLISGSLLALSLFKSKLIDNNTIKEKIIIEAEGKKINHLHGTHIDQDNNKYIHYINMLDGHRGISLTDTVHKSHLTQAFEWIQVIKLSDGNFALVWQKIGGHYIENKIWVKDLETHYFELRKEFYNELIEKIKQEDEILLNYPSLWYGKISEKKPIHNNLDEYEIHTLEQLINIHHQLKTREPNCFVIQMKKINNQKTIFFRLPEPCPNEETRLEQAHFQIPLNEFLKAILI